MHKSSVGLRHQAQSPIAAKSPCSTTSTSSFYTRPEPSFPSGNTPAAGGDGHWLGKGLQKKDPSKLNSAMGYLEATKSNLLNEKVNSTGNLNRGSRGPRGGGRGRGQNSRQGGGFDYGSKMVMASMSKNHHDQENKEPKPDLIPSLDWDLCKKVKTQEWKPQGRDVNSNQAPFGSILNGNRTPVGSKQGSTFGMAASSTPSTSAIAPHRMGFKNYKNTCYMLAPLQVLQGIPSIISSSVSLTNLVEEWEEDQPIVANNSGDIKAPSLALPWSRLCKARQDGDSAKATTQVINYNVSF